MNWTPLLLIPVLMAALMEMPLFTVIAGISSVCLYAAGRDWLSLQVVFIEMNRLASTPVLVALPLFTFIGCLLTRTAAPQRIMNLIRTLTGRLPGGVAIAALGSCAFFTALTGASGVTIVAMGAILYPVLRQRAYHDSFTLGLLTTSGSLGLLFPPSLAVILYGVIAQIPISDIFTAALIPGVMLVLLLSLYATIHRSVTGRSSAPDSDAERLVSWAEVKKRLRESLWDLPILVLLVVGVYGGFVTIAEVSAVILVYVVVVECFVLKEVKFFRHLPEVMVESAVLSGAIIIILGFALGFTGYLVDEQIPNRILNQLITLTANKYVFLAGLNLFLLAVGCIMDIFSAIVIIVPIIVPIAMQYGVDPIHLAVIFLVNLEIGYSTPPVGINLFIASLTFKQPVTRLYRASIPYLVLLLVALAVITYLPDLSLWLLGK
ncbi:MAG: C4-dicarboxylate ABC transporter [Deltaproteobacteria bacterium SG8_13]|nr:MAG: C4-dicarboxylate ABC transporter [Deltaproteobacteria bacterium SG8_13]